MPNCSIIVQEAFNAGWNFSERTVNCDRNGGGQFDIMPYMSIYLNKKFFKQTRVDRNVYEDIKRK